MTTLSGILGPLSTLAAHSDAIAWTVVAAFGSVAALEAADRRDLAVRVGAGAWVLFGVFWLSVFPRFAFGMRSPIEGTLSLLAVPACVYAGYLLGSGRDSLLTLSRAVAFMGVIYLPVETVPFVRQFLIETVAAQTDAVMAAMGRDPQFGAGPDFGYRNAFTFVGPDGGERTTYIVAACTGIGSISIFAGLVAAVRAPLRRRAKAFGIAVGVIWILNVARNAFISVAYGEAWFDQPFLVALVTGYVYDDPAMTSYFVADRVIAQTLAVVALVGVTWLVVREVPEVLDVLEEALYVCTRREVDLAAEVGIDREALAEKDREPGSDADPTAADPTAADLVGTDDPAGTAGSPGGPDPEVSTDGGGD